MMCCCRLRCLHMRMLSSFPSIFSHYLFSSNTPAERKRRAKHNWVYICVSKGIKRKTPTTKCIHFSIFFPGPSQEKKRRKRRRKRKNEIKIILCLCIYMDRIIKIMYTCGVCYITWYTFLLRHLILVSMALCVIFFFDILSLISYIHNGNCLYCCSFHACQPFFTQNK